MSYDFSAQVPSGQTLYFKITSSDNCTAAVTCFSQKESENNHVSGDLVIPSSVENNGITYAVTSIGDSAFYDCIRLRSITLPDGVTSIGKSALFGCQGLTSIILPDGVVSIGDYAFLGCLSLGSIAFPAELTTIGDSTFLLCLSLSSITVNCITAPSLEEHSFRGVPQDIPIYIPSGSLASYRERWVYFSNFIEI